MERPTKKGPRNEPSNVTVKYKKRRRTESKISLILFLLSIFLPMLGIAGHGVGDSIDLLPGDRVKQLTAAKSGKISTVYSREWNYCGKPRASAPDDHLQ